MPQPNLEARITAPEILAELGDFMADAWAAQLEELPARLAHLTPEAREAVITAASEAHDTFALTTMAACEKSVKAFVAVSRRKD